MKYRGVKYKSETSVLEIKESDILSLYKGNNWNYKLPKQIPSLQPKLFLTYGGGNYSTCANATLIENVLPPIVPHSAIINNVDRYNLEEVHLRNLKQNLERRIKVAQDTHNDNLLEMLKKESQTLAISF